jgi:formate hydrogenlyase subunit 6/NADH:ubiquinone oxidoreductase subunit I
MPAKKEDYSGPEWISLRDRFTFVDFQIKEMFFRHGGKVKVREEYCNACGHCVKICPCNVTQIVDRNKPIRIGNRTVTKVMRVIDPPYICGACGVCEAACPRDAVTVTEPISFPFSKFKTTTDKGPLKLPRLFNEKEGDA